MYFFFLCYPILGAGIKIMDAAFDEKTINRKVAFFLAPLLAILGAYAMYINIASATILLAIILGVFFTGKIDNRAHILAMLVIFPIIYLAKIEFLILPLIILVLGGIFDEVGNDFIDKRKEFINLKKFSHKFIYYFFEQRWTLKVTILLLSVVNLLPFYFFFAMILFDYSYLTVTYYSKVKIGIKKPLNVAEVVSKLAFIFK
jgi:hypothetical protein